MNDEYDCIEVEGDVEVLSRFATDDGSLVGMWFDESSKWEIVPGSVHDPRDGKEI